VIGVVTSVVSAFYYLRVVKVMYFDEPRRAPSTARITAELKGVVLVTAVVTLFFFSCCRDRSSLARRLRPPPLFYFDGPRLHPRLPPPYRLVRYDTVGSTQRRGEATGAPGLRKKETLVWALEQTAGPRAARAYLGVAAGQFLCFSGFAPPTAR